MNGRWPRGIAAVACLIWVISGQKPLQTPAWSAFPAHTQAAGYTGSAACQQCHAQTFAAWQGSDHAKSMAVADDASVLGDFDQAWLVHNGTRTDFFRRGDAFYVRTEGADGTSSTFSIAYTFGHFPLQQYLTRFPDGRLQALPLAWDTRPREHNGQRWMHLYPDEHIQHADALHWTGPALNWDSMCAQCHSTGVQPTVTVASGRVNTRWSEINVACEACHGPASHHLQWARAPDHDPLKGLSFSLRGSTYSHWQFVAGHASAQRQGSIAPDRSETDTCAGCHARRASVAAHWAPGQPLAATHQLALLEEGLYFVDGQQQDEVFEYGSFLQSKMFQAGVSCSHCHDPHSGKLRATGNAVCTQCHQSSVFDTRKHHHHSAGTAGSQCVNCHMPARTYMQVDARRDHSFRIPRPDISSRLNTPDACTGCHREHAPEWAAQKLRQWRPDRMLRPHFASALHAGRNWQPGAPAALEQLSTDTRQAGIVRASALHLLLRYPGPRLSRAVHMAALDPDPLLRREAAAALPGLPVEEVLTLAPQLLTDPMLTVRVETAQRLLELPAEARKRLDSGHWRRGLEELRSGLEAQRYRAEALLGLALLEQHQGNLQASESLLQEAVERQPQYAPAWVQLSDLLHHSGQPAQARALLHKALNTLPEAADLHYALALTQIRTGTPRQAVPAFARAAQLAPDIPHYSYTWAIALQQTGEPEQALQVLEAASQRFPGHPQLMALLTQYATAARRGPLAQRALAQWQAIDPEPADSIKPSFER